MMASCVLPFWSRIRTLKGTNLRFETADGRVTLREIVESGTCRSRWPKSRSRHLPGVAGITNELEVCW